MKKLDLNLEKSVEISGQPQDEKIVSSSSKFETIILAAGLSSRMGDDTSKTMKTVKGRSILNRLLDQFRADTTSINVILGFKSNQIENHVSIKSKVTFLYNSFFKEDKNILSCNIGLKNTSQNVLIVEGDVILTSLDVSSIINRIESKPSKSFVCSQRICQSNESRIGCVAPDGKISLLESRNPKDLRNRMSGIFYFARKDVEKIIKRQDSLLTSSMDFYYFEPLLDDKKIDIENLELTENAQTVNTREELEWALKKLS